MYKVVLFLVVGVFSCYPLVGCTEAVTVPESPPVNVLLLVVDTLRADVLSCYGGKEIETPNIDSLAADGLLFERAISSASWTVPAMASILTGLSPLTHKAKANVKYSGKIESLQVRLQQHGYRTHARLAENGFLKAEAGNFDIGFDTYEWGSAATKQQALVDLIEENKDVPLFLWLHLMNPHLPYKAPGETEYVFFGGNQLNNVRRGFGARTAEQRNRIKKAYLAEVRYVDTYIGLLLDYLREAGLYDDMLIVFVSDHGEEFWEHDGFEHGHTMYDELLNVPLIIKLPGSSAVGIRKEVVGTQSLLPTILDVCSVEYDLAEMQATSLEPFWAASEAVTPQRVHSASPLYFEERESLTTGKWKYILSYVSQREEIYDLERDPLEQRNLFYERPEIVVSMREAMMELHKELRQFQIRGDSGGDNKVEFDEDVKANLRAIGYLE